MSNPGIDKLEMRPRIKLLYEKMFGEKRFASIEQAKIVTDVYKNNPSVPRNLQRALALKQSLEKITIKITPGELIVSNRTPGVRGGVVSPEAGLRWLLQEIESLPTRPQDRFEITQEDIDVFRRDILPFWRGKSLEDFLDETIGHEMAAISKVVKINQTDHSQGHICPNTVSWLEHGPKALRDAALSRKALHPEKADFYDGIAISLDGACSFMKRYAQLAREMAKDARDAAISGVCNANPALSDASANVGTSSAASANAGASSADASCYISDLLEVARIWEKLSGQPAESFHEALQSVWFLNVILHMESNASSFSPGRMDRFLYPYYKRDIDSGKLTDDDALELIECLFLKFNQIVYMRSSSSAKYFAGFPIGFNVALGGQTESGGDAANELSFLMLRAQEHLKLPQPNLSARLFHGSSGHFLTRCAEVIGKGSGMPQLFNDEAIIPALESKGISHADAKNYAIVGCVELTTMGKSLGWSDAAMFNIVKELELALNNGRCLLSGKQLGAETGSLVDFKRFEDVENALEAQIDFFFGRMIRCCEIVEKAHADLLPSPFLSAVIDNCTESGIDVTSGGALYNLSGIQAIQCANIADSLAALKELVYDKCTVSRSDLQKALKSSFEGYEGLRQILLKDAPKYGNDVPWVDEIAHKWARIFCGKLDSYTNIRGGPYHMGLYTVSAHVPMGANVGATPDGRLSGQPLADGGISPVYGRDVSGPTAVLKSVSKIDSLLSSNGALLNMKFLPHIFKKERDISKFVSLLRAFVTLKVVHAQFNVVNRDTLIAAQKQPELYRSLIIRVAGYSAYFTELASDLQQEIIERTEHSGL